MRKLLRVVILIVGVLGLAHESSAQFCPGVSPWVFDDVPASDPFCGYITKMAQRGITLGCAVLDANHRLYCPFDGVTRGQMAAFIGRFGDVVFAQGGNAFGAPAVVGTNDLQPFELRVGGARGLRLERRDGRVNVIAGHEDNYVGATVRGGTIAGGGGLAFDANSVIGDLGTVGGGMANQAGGFTTIGGGWSNSAVGLYATISGGGLNLTDGVGATIAGGYNNYAAESATIGGGLANVASQQFAVVAGGSQNESTGSGSAIGGGRGNVASGGFAVIAGGANNYATGDRSTIGGGFGHVANAQYSAVLAGYANFANAPYAAVLAGTENEASGPFSVVLGYKGLTTANATGSFVYSDSSTGKFGSGQPNEFLVGATGGIGMYTSKVYASGCKIAPGGAQWQCFSSRDGKADLVSIDPSEILDRVVALPISTWRYRGEAETIRHLGPMAQDFHAAFGLGDENTSIGVLDGSGVALAAIQGLSAKFEATIAEQDARIKRQAAEIADLRSAVEVLMARIAEGRVAAR